jgi:hypothetical protein
VRIGAGSECSRLFMANVHPSHLALAAQGVGEAIERVAGNSVNAPHAGGMQGLDDGFGDGLRHGSLVQIRLLLPQ